MMKNILSSVLTFTINRFEDYNTITFICRVGQFVKDLF